jgi:hypothetical protein
MNQLNSTLPFALPTPSSPARSSPRRHVNGILFAAILGASTCTAGQAQVIRLAGPGEANGAPVSACRSALTGEGVPPVWEPLLVHNIPALFETSNHAIRHRFSLCIVDSIQATNVDLAVSFTPLGGKISRVAGLIFRTIDAENYYVACANALENNVRLYRVLNGVRQQLGAAGVSVPMGTTQELRIRIVDDLIEVSFNGRKLFEARDKTFQKSGAVGITTEADSLTAFYELTVSDVKE